MRMGVHLCTNCNYAEISSKVGLKICKVMDPRPKYELWQYSNMSVRARWTRAKLYIPCGFLCDVVPRLPIGRVEKQNNDILVKVPLIVVAGSSIWLNVGTAHQCDSIGRSSSLKEMNGYLSDREMTLKNIKQHDDELFGGEIGLAKLVWKSRPDVWTSSPCRKI